MFSYFFVITVFQSVHTYILNIILISLSISHFLINIVGPMVSLENNEYVE